MKKWNMLTVAALVAFLLIGMSACSDSSDKTGSDTISESADDSSTDSTMKSDNSGSQNEDSQEQATNADTSTETTSEHIQEDHPPETVTKIEGRKTEFLEKLDNIQKEMDAMPYKKDSDKGVTNAMKNYYGVSYDKYDDALNEIYALLKKELSPEVMAELKTEQVKWIEQKEEKAEKERMKYEGGTFENVALLISLNESTKDRCYELVNEYMTD